jgi:hypothetical protein
MVTRCETGNSTALAQAGTGASSTFGFAADENPELGRVGSDIAIGWVGARVGLGGRG